MLTLSESQRIIEQEIRGINFLKDPELLYEPIQYTLGLGGKRIRPAMLLMATQLFNSDFSRGIKPALAVEIFHNFTLLHDDIMDAAPLRRGQSTVHKKWNNNVAILSGDAMLIKAYEYLSYAPSDVLPRLIPVFNKTALEVCEGQQYDMDFENSYEVQEKDYMNMIRLKTAVLLAASLKMGAICGGATDHEADLLYNFGIQVGMAFQLQDDLLDVYADPGKFGKTTGGDILSNKKTFLLINAIHRSESSQKKELLNWIGLKEFDPIQKIAAVKGIYDDLNLPGITKETIKYYSQKGNQILSEIEKLGKNVEEFKNTMELLVIRDH